MKTARKIRRAKAKPRRLVRVVARAKRVVSRPKVSAKRVRGKAIKARRIPRLISRKRAQKITVKVKSTTPEISLKPPVAIHAKKRVFRSRAALNGCSRRKLTAFAEGRMELDEKLDTLYHLDRCQKCWDDLYLIRKSKNGQLYSRKTRSYSEADIKALEKVNLPAEEEDALAEAEDAFDVA